MPESLPWRSVSDGDEPQRRVLPTMAHVVQETSMNERRVLIVVALFIWQVIGSVAYAADDDTGLLVGVRLPFGGATSGPARLSLSIASSNATHGAVQSADIASLDFGAHGKL